MVDRTGTSERFGFLPRGAGTFLRQRAMELLGLALFSFAGLLAATLASYHPEDPSWNTAGATEAQNWIGTAGAYAADLILQTVGIAGIVPALALTAWGWRLVSHRGLPWIWLHLGLLPLSLLAAATFVATLPAPAGWPLPVGFGGFIGRGLMTTLAGGVPVPLFGVIVGTVALVALFFTLGVSHQEWWSVGRGTAWFARRSSRAARRATEGLIHAGRIATRGIRREPRLVADAEAPAPRPKVEIATRSRDGDGADDGPRVARRVPRLKKSRRAEREEQPDLDLTPSGEYQLPPLHLLQLPNQSKRVQTINEDALEQNARLLESVLEDYGVRGRIIKVRPGPVVTLYELEPAPGTKTSRVIGLADDIARSMSAVSVRVATVPGRNVIGIELPNALRETVYLRELLATPEYERAGHSLTLALGKDIGGQPIIADLAKMPHLLIAGTTGSGKSVAINTMILSLLYRLSPEQCRMIMIDPKMLELSVYDDIPHLLTPVVTDPGKAVVALKWTVREMENRYKAMARLGVRNIASYNLRLAEARAKGEELKRTVQTGFDPETGEPVFEQQPLDLKPMCLIVVVVDEMADLMMVAGKDIEGAIQRLAQMARAAGIHLIMATQRPSVDVITGTIKANFPTRISFQVTSKIDSRTILGEQGAEQLLGQGDMLYMAGGGRITRVHGPFVADQEVEEVVAYLKRQGLPDYLDAVTEEPDGEASGEMFGGAEGDGGQSGDDLYDRAVDTVARFQKASTSFIQRRLGIGYNRAASLIERMEDEGIVGPPNHVGKREIFVRRPDEEA